MGERAEQDEIFREAFRSGLTSVAKSNQGKLEQLRDRTGLPIKRVKKRILNMRRGPQKKRKVQATVNLGRKSHFTGYNLFCQTVEVGDQSSNRPSEWGKRWAQLPDAEKASFKQRAEAIKQRPLDSLNQEEKKIMSSTIIRSIKQQIDELHHLDTPCLFFSFLNGMTESYATESEASLLNEFVEKVTQRFVSKNEQTQPIKEQEPEVPELRRRVQQKLATAYGNYLKKPPKSFPYKLYREGKLRISIKGLPASMDSLREPGRMGRRQLLDILNSSIIFEKQSEPNIDSLATLPGAVSCQMEGTSGEQSMGSSVPSSLVLSSPMEGTSAIVPVSKTTPEQRTEESPVAGTEPDEHMTPIIGSDGEVLAHVRCLSSENNCPEPLTMDDIPSPEEQAAAIQSVVKKLQRKGQQKKKNKQAKPKQPKGQKKKEKSRGGRKSTTEDVPCLFCGEGFLSGKTAGNWCLCENCKKWAHCSCAGLEENDESKYICDICKC